MCLNLGKEIPLTVGRGEEVYIPASQNHSMAELCVSPTFRSYSSSSYSSSRPCPFLTWLNSLGYSCSMLSQMSMSLALSKVPSVPGAGLKELAMRASGDCLLGVILKTGGALQGSALP